MDEITIRNLDEAVIRRLRRLASEEGLPLEESLRRLLVEVTQNRECRHLNEIFPAPTD